MRISVRQRANRYERYAPGFLDSQIGKQLPLTVMGQGSGRATLVAANVAADGSEVELTLEVPDDVRPWVEAGSAGRNRDDQYLSGPLSHYATVPLRGPHFDLSLSIARPAGE